MNYLVLYFLNIKMEMKKNLKNKKDVNEEDEEEWSLVKRIGCIN